MTSTPNDRIGTTSVSVDVVETDPIVLRESDTRRLVFLPTIVERDQPLRGTFVYQRKLKAGEWEDIRDENFNSLKSGEGWALELRTAEVGALMEGLLAPSIRRAAREGMMSSPVTLTRPEARR